jgi:hypothetical protein
MDEERLVEAMRLGTHGPYEERSPDDLGRFGLGLKTASFSQAKYFAVSSKDASGRVATRFWDLDHIRTCKSWLLGKKPSENYANLIQELMPDDSTGTVVLWRKLDRVCVDKDDSCDAESIFFQKFTEVKRYLEMVFHQFLEGRSSLTIRVGEGDCVAWNPYLTSNSFHQELSSEKYEDSRVKVVPYILPHVSKRTPEENSVGAGPRGWNGQQGFYVYRNKRMIVSGGYLDFDLKEDEHYKLARIKVEISNDMDHEWNLDVRKAVATPPDHLKGELLRVARATRKKAAEVYRARTGRPRQVRGADNLHDVWKRHRKGEKISYRINPDHPVLNHLLKELNPSKRWVNKLFKVIEDTVPHQTILMDGIEHEDCHVPDWQEESKPKPEMIDLAFELYDGYRAKGHPHGEAVNIVCSIPPFDISPVYRANLDDAQGVES